MLPVKKKQQTFRTLEEIRVRKDELTDELQKDNERFTKLWNQVFVKRSESTKGEFVSSIITNSITAVDLFLLGRKLLKNYRTVFRKK